MISHVSLELDIREDKLVNLLFDTFALELDIKDNSKFTNLALFEYLSLELGDEVPNIVRMIRKNNKRFALPPA